MYVVVARTNTGTVTQVFNSYDSAVRCAKTYEVARIYGSDGERATLIWVGGKSLVAPSDRDAWRPKSKKAQQVLF